MNTAQRNITPIPTIRNFNYMFRIKHKKMINYINTSRKVILIMLTIITLLTITNIITLVNNHNLKTDLKNLQIAISEAL